MGKKTPRALPLIIQNIHFVYLSREDFAFARLPYIRESAKRQLENYERLMCFVFKCMIIQKVRPDLNFNYIALSRLQSDVRFDKWIEDMAAELKVDSVELQLAALSLAGNM